MLWYCTFHRTISCLHVDFECLKLALWPSFLTRSGDKHDKRSAIALRLPSWLKLTILCIESFQLCVCFVSSMSELIWPLQNRWTVMVQDDLGLQTWRVNIFPWYTFHKESVLIRVNSEYGNTVEPVYNGHPRDLRNWPLIFSLIYTNVTIPYFNGFPYP